ncbi:hypothetical protein ACFSCW_13515 [Sphingomonas tabacisoli]|uniref:DUF2631 domain-containing protein n=1 Tax=Sphingomonas tabacisoli TaxID=2249466 RepID=A0ABW4I4D2_9SPHN
MSYRDLDDRVDGKVQPDWKRQAIFAFLFIGFGLIQLFGGVANESWFRIVLSVALIGYGVFIAVRFWRQA